MIGLLDVKTYLRDIARTRRNIFSKIKEGDVVPKSRRYWYVVDNVEVFRQLGDFEEGVLPYGSINRYLHGPRQEIVKLFGGRLDIKFSEAVSSRLGECLEKSLLAHLIMQRINPTFLVRGYMNYSEEIGGWLRAFNIYLTGKESFLIDTQLPIQSNGGKKTFIVPIFGISEINERVLIPQYCGRNYYLRKPSFN